MILSRSIMLLGEKRVKEILDSRLRFRICDHSTGCQAHIYANDGDLEMEVWEGSIWHSPCYEFNDRNKVLGLKPDAGFCAESIDEFFAQMERELAAREAAANAKREADLAAANLERQQKAEHFKRNWN